MAELPNYYKVSFDGLTVKLEPIYEELVEVVRCKDCKWAEYGKDYEPYCNRWESGLYGNIKDDDFCSYGERKDNE